MANDVERPEKQKNFVVMMVREHENGHNAKQTQIFLSFACLSVSNLSDQCAIFLPFLRRIFLRLIDKLFWTKKRFLEWIEPSPVGKFFFPKIKKKQFLKMNKISFHGKGERN